VRAGYGLEDAAGAPQVAARRPGRGRPGSWAWRHHPPTAACSGEQTQPKELVLSRGRQGLTDHMRSRDLQFFFSEHAEELRICIKKKVVRPSQRHAQESDMFQFPAQRPAGLEQHFS